MIVALTYRFQLPITYYIYIFIYIYICIGVPCCSQHFKTKPIAISRWTWPKRDGIPCLCSVAFLVFSTWLGKNGGRVPPNRSDVRYRAKEDPFQHLSLLVSFIYLLFSAKSGGCSVYLNFLKPYFIFVYLFVGWWSPMTRIWKGGWRKTKAAADIPAPRARSTCEVRSVWQALKCIDMNLSWCIYYIILYIPIYSMMWVVLCKCIIGCVHVC